MAKKNFGILASVDWNSNEWKDLPTEAEPATNIALAIWRCDEYILSFFVRYSTPVLADE